MNHCNSTTMRVVLVLLCIAQTGCATTSTLRNVGKLANLKPTEHSGPKPTEQICYTRSEHARIAAFKARCRHMSKQLRKELAYQQTKTTIAHNSENKKLRIRLQTCLKQATTTQTCPSCFQPVLLAGGIGLVVGVVATLSITIAMNKP